MFVGWIFDTARHKYIFIFFSGLIFWFCNHCWECYALIHIENGKSIFRTVSEIRKSVLILIKLYLIIKTFYCKEIYTCFDQTQLTQTHLSSLPTQLGVVFSFFKTRTHQGQLMLLMCGFLLECGWLVTRSYYL